MNFRGTILAGTAAILLSSVSVLAADLGGMKGGSIKDGYIPAEPQHHGRLTGLYLRGDFTWASQDLGSIHEPPAYDLHSTSIDTTTAFGGGVGYYFSKNVRADFTYDWRREADVRGTVSDTHATVQGERQFGVKSAVGLFNVYYDFDIRSHFTPYIGVGLGFARNTTSAGNVAVTCATDCVATFEGATEWSAAGALMAGFSARLHDRLHFDAGYRFLYLGDAHTGNIQVACPTATPGCTPAESTDPLVKDMHAHELRVGLRWDIK